ncbi:MAG: ABC transporter permease [Longimicrobiales bacterium]
MKNLFRMGEYRPDPDGEIRDEIQTHLEMKVRELMEEGLSPEEARQEARRRFGPVDEIQEEARRYARARSRRERRGAILESLTQDLRFAFRTLRRSPGFTALAVLTLALGVGASTTIFSVADATLFGSLPFREAETLVFLQGAYMAEDLPRIRGASVPEARDWGNRNRTLKEAAAYGGTVFNLTGDLGAERVQGEVVDEGYFRVFGVTALRGRTFAPEETRAPGGPRTALVGESLWERRWGRDPGLLGETIYLDDIPCTVVGIIPDDFSGASLQAEVWVPMAVARPSRMDSRGSRSFGVAGRTLPGRTLEDVQADLDGVAAELEAEFPEAHEQRGVLVVPARDLYLGDTRLLILVVFGATGLLLLISAINVTNLLLARASDRTGEISVRTAVGAGRGRILRQLLTESLVLSLLGSGLGLVLAMWSIGALPALLPTDLLPGYVSLKVDGRMLFFSAALMAAVGLGVGLAPALLASRTAIAAGVKGAGRRNPGGLELQGYLVMGEVALSLLLLVGAGLMTRSLQAQLREDPGFETVNLMAFRLQLTGDRYAEDGLVAGVMDLQARLESIPEVESVSFGSNLPMRGLSGASYLWLPGMQEVEDRVRFYHHRVSPGYLEALGARMIRGGGFPPGVAAEDPDMALISQALAARFFPDSDPVGQTLNLFRPGENPVTIAGVVEDIRYRGITTDPMSESDDPDIFLPWMSVPSEAVEFLVRTRARPEAVFSDIRDTVKTFDPDLVPYLMQPMDEVLRGETATVRSASAVLGIFSGSALFLAGMGIYGMLAYAVRRRRRELAIRMAVGAEPGAMIRIVTRRAMILVGGGCILGLGAAALAARALSSFLYQTPTVDPMTYGATILAVLVASGLATLIPALRASRVDPHTALRTE